MTSSDPFKVLIADKIADEGIDLVRAVADVDIALNQSEDELCKKIENYDPSKGSVPNSYIIGKGHDR